MKTFKILLNKIITFFKKKPNNLKPQSEEPVKTEVKRLVYTKRTDQ